MATVVALSTAKEGVYRVVFDDSTAVTVHRTNLYTLSPALNAFCKTGVLPPTAAAAAVDPKKKAKAAAASQEHYMPGKHGAGAATARSATAVAAAAAEVKKKGLYRGNSYNASFKDYERPPQTKGGAPVAGLRI
jgi:hypothetical protein